MTTSSADNQTGEARRGPYVKGVQRRREILDKAIDAFVHRRIDAPTLRSLADAIGESHRTVQHYFPTREALLVEVLREHEAALLHEQGQGPLVDNLERAAQRNVRTPGIVALHTEMLALSVALNDVDAKAFFTERFERARRDLAEQIAAEHVSSDLSAEEREAIAAVILAAFDGLQIQWLLNPDLDLPKLLGFVDSLILGSR